MPPATRVPVIGPGGRSILAAADSEQRAHFDHTLRVGRHPLNDLVLEHPRISGHHAVLEALPEGGRIKDLGSRNGTSVNGRRIRGWRSLKTGDTVRFGGIATWTVEAMAPPGLLGNGIGTLETTERARPGAEPPQLHLYLAFDGPGDGVIRVEHTGRTWTAHAGLRFILLWVLAGAGGDWVRDEDLKTKLWGHTGAAEVDRSAFYKLLHDTRQMFAHKGVDGVLIEKRPGSTRLRLPPDHIHVGSSPRTP